MINHLLALLQFICIYIIGAAGFTLVFPKRKTSLTELLAASFAIGVVIEMTLLSTGVLLQQFFLFYLLLYPLVVLAIYILWKKSFLKNVVILTQEKFLAGAVGFFLLIQTITNFAFPLLGNDARAMWLLKAKAIAMGPAYFIQYIENPTSGHPDYPLGLSSIFAIFYKIIPQFAEPYISMFATLFFVSLVYLFAAALIKRYPKIETFWYLIITGLVFFISIYVSQGWSGYVDVPLSLFFALTIYGFLSVEKEHAQGWIVLILLAIAGGLLTKNEGLTWALGSLLLCIPLVVRYIKKDSYIYLGTVLAACLLPTLGWMFVKSQYHINNDLVAGSQSGRDLLFYIKRVPVLIEETLMRLLNGYLFGVLWIPALIGWLISAGNTIKSKTFDQWLPYLLVIFQAAVYIVVYLFTPYDLTWHISTSFTRLVLHLLPSIYLIVVLQFPIPHHDR